MERIATASPAGLARFAGGFVLAQHHRRRVDIEQWQQRASSAASRLQWAQ